jgi:hypothetical protein
VLLLIAMPVASQAPQADKSFSGTLTKVDAAKKVITVKGTGAEPEMTFIYDDKTQVTGAEKNVEGLTGKTGAALKVTYQEKGADGSRRESRFPKLRSNALRTARGRGSNISNREDLAQTLRHAIAIIPNERKSRNLDSAAYSEAAMKLILKSCGGLPETVGQPEPTESHCLRPIRHKRLKHFHESDESELMRPSAKVQGNL